MPIRLDKRLSLCTEFVSRGGYVLDVGTDHAYLPCYLVESGICSRAAASDIADGPLAAARRTVAQCGLESRITLYKSDGLADIPEEVITGVTDIVAAGMGGELIAKILSGRTPPKTAGLILQPNSRASVLRRFLCASGYETLSERAVCDGKFIYTVINARFTGDCREPDEFECAVGALDPHDVPSRAYLERKSGALRAAAEGMARAVSEEQRREAEHMLALAGKIDAYIGGRK